MTDAVRGWSDAEFEDLKKVFFAEAHELADELQDSLMRIEGDPDREGLLKAVKRYVHTLKGDSNSIGLGAIGALCHRMEDVLAGLMDGSVEIDHESVDLLLACVDAVLRMLAESEAGGTPSADNGMISRIGRFLERQPGAAVRGPGTSPGAGEAGETGAGPIGQTAQGPEPRSEMLRIEAPRLDKIMNLTGELIIGRSMIEQVLREIENVPAVHDAAARLFAVNTYLERTVSDLQNGVMKMRMVPVNQVFRKFPKMVRDLSNEKGKSVRLELLGKETELDKHIVDALGEPLAHLVRNMIDHGIEPPEDRGAAGKAAEGVIRLRAYHEAAQFVIEASDDGKGIDTDRIRSKAVESGFLKAQDAAGMSEQEAVELIFCSGLSTAETVSETSGRGVGMDAVKSAVEGLKGSIEVLSDPGRGTLFRMRLPLTLAVIRALLFQVGERRYAVPLSVVSEITKVAEDGLVTVDGRDTLLLRDMTLSIIRVERLFHVAGGTGKNKFVLHVGIGGNRVGLLVDRIVGQQELVIKSFEADYASSGLIAGASILGDGKVVVILDAAAVVRKAVEDERRSFRAA